MVINVLFSIYINKKRRKNTVWLYDICKINIYFALNTHTLKCTLDHFGSTTLNVSEISWAIKEKSSHEKSMVWFCSFKYNLVEFSEFKLSRDGSVNISPGQGYGSRLIEGHSAEIHTHTHTHFIYIWYLSMDVIGYAGLCHLWNGYCVLW